MSIHASSEVTNKAFFDYPNYKLALNIYIYITYIQITSLEAMLITGSYNGWMFRIDMVIAPSTAPEPLQAHPAEVLSTPAFNVVATVNLFNSVMAGGTVLHFHLPLSPHF